MYESPSVESRIYSATKLRERPRKKGVAVCRAVKRTFQTHNSGTHPGASEAPAALGEAMIGTVPIGSGGMIRSVVVHSRSNAHVLVARQPLPISSDPLLTKKKRGSLVVADGSRCVDLAVTLMKRNGYYIAMYFSWF